MSTLEVRRLSSYATIQTQTSSNDIGMTLYSAYDYLLPRQGKIVVKTDIAVKIPKQMCGKIAPLSNLPSKHPFEVPIRIINHEYNSNIGVPVYNLSVMDYEIKRGNEIAQLICEKVEMPIIQEVFDSQQEDHQEDTEPNEIYCPYCCNYHPLPRWEFCNAYGKVCYSCGKYSHFQIACHNNHQKQHYSSWKHRNNSQQHQHQKWKHEQPTWY